MSLQTQATRLLGAAALAISVAACDSATAPSPQPPQTPPQTSPPPTLPPAGTVSGTALDFTSSGSGRPVPNLRLKVRQIGPTGGASGGAELADVVTDANGRYTITGVTQDLWFQTASGSDYRFLCDFHPVPMRGSISLFSDLPVVRNTWSGTRPPNNWLIGTTVYGIVSERVGGSLQPVAGATVDWGSPDPPATTSETGFYLICSMVGTDQYRNITASKAGYNPVAREIFAGWDREVNHELTRR
jgi:hypothetical protein